MWTMYPERVVAVWLGSGTAFAAWEKGGVFKPALSERVYQVPVMCNPGVEENGDKHLQGAWTGPLEMFQCVPGEGRAHRLRARPADRARVR
jgi:hypothetical protein